MIQIHIMFINAWYWLIYWIKMFHNYWLFLLVGALQAVSRIRSPLSNAGHSVTEGFPGLKRVRWNARPFLWGMMDHTRALLCTVKTQQTLVPRWLQLHWVNIGKSNAQYSMAVISCCHARSLEVFEWNGFSSGLCLLHPARGWSFKQRRATFRPVCVCVCVYIYTIIYLQAGGFAVGKQVVTWSIYLCFVGRNGRRRIFAQNWVGLIFARFRSLTMLRDWRLVV